MCKTNVERIVDVMQFSAYGALSQVFVVDAVVKHAEAVAKATPDELAAMEGGPVSPAAWQGVAREIAGKMAAYMKPSP